LGEDGERRFLRATFDESADAYERSRLVAPAELFDDLVALARLEPGARLVEIGCGTGQATLPLAERGFEVLGIELGENLAELARRKLAPFPAVTIVTSSFEEWEPPAEPFDGVVSFNAFHWIDPDVRFAKSAEVLRPGGALAVMGSAFVEHDGADSTWLALQADYEQVVGEPEPRPHVDAARDRTAEFEAGGHFRNVSLRRYLWSSAFDADAYVERLSTSSWHRALGVEVREELFERIRSRIRAAPGQRVVPTTAAVLYVAERI
jgi:cyclopropane fatty-acyl-phospholipid synthase-like methyltransferase